MRKFHYRAGRNAFVALGMGALAVLCAMSWFNGAGGFSLAGLLLFGAAALKSGLDAMSDQPALSFSSEILRVRTPFGTQQVRWSEVQGISLEVFTYRYWGIIPIAKHENLVVKCNGGTFGAKRLRIAVKSIELPPGGSAALVLLLHEQHVAAVGEAGVVMAGAGAHGWGVRHPAARTIDDSEQASSFDPDAALARYLAAREATTPGSPRGSTAPAAVPQPLGPVRAGFGRKGL